jgi:hypothetical protein
LLQEHEQRPGRQGLRAGAELSRRAVLQEQEKLPGRQGLKAGAECLVGW